MLFSLYLRNIPKAIRSEVRR